MNEHKIFLSPEEEREQWGMATKIAIRLLAGLLVVAASAVAVGWLTTLTP